MCGKVCSKCNEEKPLSEYHRRSDSADGYRAQCKMCHAETSQAWMAANRERKAETDRAWREANRERKAETNLDWWKANPGKRAEYGAHYRVKHPDRAAARSEVTKAVMRGDFPPASTQVCITCGSHAEQYHHHLGYEPEHALDVVAVCLTCHVELDKAAERL